MSANISDESRKESREERILVIGATGYTGRAVVEQLSARTSAQVWAHIRPDSSALSQWRGRVEQWENVELSTAPWSDEAIDAELKRIDPTHVFLLLGTTKARGKSGSGSAVADTYEAVDYGLTHLVIEANKRIERPGRVVYLSSLGVKQGTSNPYLKVRARIEAELQESSCSWVAVRASFISGADREESRPMERFAAIASKPFLAVVGTLGARGFQRRFQPHTADELATRFIDCAFDRSLDGVVHLDELPQG